MYIFIRSIIFVMIVMIVMIIFGYSFIRGEIYLLHPVTIENEPFTILEPLAHKNKIPQIGKGVPVCDFIFKNIWVDPTFSGFIHKLEVTNLRK